jgi:alcohol dehydrogenase (NADP+)
MKTLTYANGESMPMLGLGTWKSSAGVVYEAVIEALKLGYRHIDCAPIYGNEPEVGQALAEAFSRGIVARDQVWITSKLWNNAHFPEDVRPAMEKTLTDLGLDYLDLFLMHWPIAYRQGVLYHKSAADFVPLEELPIIDTWRKMEELFDDGLCRHLGVSNFSTVKLKALKKDARIQPEMNQIELHPYLQQPQMLDFCEKQGVFLTGYAPLGSSDRPDRLKIDNEPILLEDPKIAQIAERHQATPAQVVLSWALHRGTAVIPKSVRPERLNENLTASEISLTEEEILEIASLNRDRRYITGTFWAVEGGPYTLKNIWDE